MNNVFTHQVAIPTFVGVLGYVRAWKSIASGMTAKRELRGTRGHCVTDT